MMTLNNQSVNVSRAELIKCLSNNLKIHQKEYKQAVIDYQKKIKDEVNSLKKRIEKGDFTKVRLNIEPPVSHEKDFQNVIEMLGMSVDEVIQLDSGAYKAYVKNEWPWGAGFKALINSYKS